MSTKPSVLIFNWKDITHPKAGGAEVVTHELMKRLVKDGHKVTLLTARYPGASELETIDGIETIRQGSSRFGHYFAAWKYYSKHLKNKFDIIIEEINTLPYLSGFYKGDEKHFLFYHQLAREIWFYEMVQPLSTIGYLLVEPLLTYLNSRTGSELITVSESTKQDIMRFGFDAGRISIISEGLENTPISSLEDSAPKEKDFTILFHSSLRDMKRPIEVMKAFHGLVKQQPDAMLWYSGGGKQWELRKFAEENGIMKNVTFFGRTTDEQKFDLMQRAHVLCSTSIKEGWGLIVTEACSQGTPVIVYDVDGLRDAGKQSGGDVVTPTPEGMTRALLSLKQEVESDPKAYEKRRRTALKASKKITFDQSYKDFINIILK